jgi:hypothetical protein
MGASRRKAKSVIQNPAEHFASPRDLIHEESLSHDEKRKALEVWEEDSRRLSVAEEEGMTGGERSQVVEVAEAQTKLGMKRSRRKRSPTKVG